MSQLIKFGSRKFLSEILPFSQADHAVDIVAMYLKSLQILFFTVSICLLVACSLTSPETSQSEKYNISGAVGVVGQVKGTNDIPATGAFVYAYRNMKSHLRGPADFEAQVNEDGNYFLDLVEGDYYLVARMRQSGADAGPPRAGDAWALPKKNPVTVEPGKVSTINFVLQGISQPRLMREGTLTSGDTGFTGLLVDVDGNLIPGAFVIAYPDTDYQRMPEATSPAVGEDGRFHLYVEREGRWCLAARTRTRGQPIAGEPYGLLGEGKTGCRDTVSGKILDIGTIILRPYR